MKKFKGQNLIEMSIISILVFLLCASVLFLSGNNLASNVANLFEKNNLISLFGGNRTQNPDENTAIFLSKSYINLSALAGKKAPVEEVIRDQLNSGEVTTSGSAGKIKQVAEMIQKYVEQLRSLLAGMPASAQKTSLETALTNFENAASGYTDLDGQYANDPAKKLASQLDFLVNIDQNGSLATSLNTALNSYLATLSDGPQKELMDIYVNDMLNLGVGLDYTIDSRMRQTLGLAEESTTSTSFNTSIDNLTGALNSVSAYSNWSIQITKYKVNNLIQNLNSINNSTNISSRRLSRQINMAKRNIDSALRLISSYLYINPNESQVSTLKTTLTSLKNSLTTDSTSSVSKDNAIKLSNILKSSTITDAQKEEYVKKISVYLNGNYNEILPNSYNTDILNNVLNKASQ